MTTPGRPRTTREPGGAASLRGDAARPGRTRPGARRPRGPQHAPRVPFALLVVGLIAGGLGLLLLLNTASAANEVRRHDLAAQDASVAAQVQELQVEVAASAAPGNLAQAAAALGMVPAGNPAFLVLGRDGSVRVLGSAAPVSAAVDAQIPSKQKKKPKPSASATPTHGATSTAKSTARSTATSTAHGAHTSAAHSSGHSTPASPTPTPTPTVTLPGGNR